MLSRAPRIPASKAPPASLAPPLAARRVLVHGRPARYWVAGEGHPLVVVPGLSGSVRWWSRNLAALASARRVHLVELPGFRRARRGESFVLAEAPAWLAGWMDAVGLAHADVAGHSMGAGIALQVAAERPELVDRLVLVAPTGLASGRSLLGHTAPLLRALLLAGPRFAGMLVRDAARAGPVSLLRASVAVTRLDLRETLASVASPTLLVWGERDPLVPLAVSEPARRALRDCRLVVLERAGHVPMFEAPDAFNEALLRFLREETA